MQKIFLPSPRNSIKNAMKLKSGSITSLDKSLNGYVNGIGFKAFAVPTALAPFVIPIPLACVP